MLVLNNCDYTYQFCVPERQEQFLQLLKCKRIKWYVYKRIDHLHLLWENGLSFLKKRMWNNFFNNGQMLTHYCNLWAENYLFVFLFFILFVTVKYQGLKSSQ